MKISMSIALSNSSWQTYRFLLPIFLWLGFSNLILTEKTWDPQCYPMQSLYLLFLANICYLFFSLVFVSYLSPNWKVVSPVILFSLQFFYFCFFLRLRSFSIALFIIAHSFSSQVLFSRFGPFLLLVSLSQVFMLMVFFFVPHWVKRFFICVAKLSNAIYSAKSTFLKKSHWIGGLCLILCLLLDYILLSVS